MTDKQAVIDALKRLPEDASLEDITEELRIMASIRRGRADMGGVARSYSSILRLCRQHQLSSYDAAYLDLAQIEGVPLATLDKNLRAAAKACSVDLLTG